MLDGEPAPDAAALMRSRYTAYAVGDFAHLIRTTYPDSPHHGANRRAWMESLRAFSEETSFEGLDVQYVAQSGEEAVVQFRASLEREGKDVSFTERSRFRRVGGRWLYFDGEG